MFHTGFFLLYDFFFFVDKWDIVIGIGCMAMIVVESIIKSMIGSTIMQLYCQYGRKICVRKICVEKYASHFSHFNGFKDI